MTAIAKTKARKAQQGLVTTVDRIQELHVRRTLWHRAEKSLTLQCRSFCRRVMDGDKDAGSSLYESVAKLSREQIDRLIKAKDTNQKLYAAITNLYPILIMRQDLEKQRHTLEEQLELLVIELPIYEWASKIQGVGPGSVAAIIGSTGNLWNYATVQKVWKRMGLAVAPDGRRQRNIRNQTTAKEGGYNAQRRATMWTIGTAIMMVQSERLDKETGEVKRQAGEYRMIFDKRRAYEEAKNANGDYAPLAKAILTGSGLGKATTSYKAYSQGKLPKAHLKNRAQRYMEKELLKRFWVEWRRSMGDAKPREEAPETAVRKPIVFVGS